MSILESIRYEGDNNTLIYRMPETNFATYSRLTVKDTQEAILFAEGRMCDTFRGGAYTLHTKNIPILRALVNLPFGGESPFQCEVYFINRALSLNHKWGTTSRTRVFDSTCNLYLDMGASGSMGLRVVDPRKAMMEIVGSGNILTADQCIDYFRANISMRVKNYLANIMAKPGMNFIVLERNLETISEELQTKLNEDFSDLGMEIYKFVLENVVIPDEQLAVVTQGAQMIKQLEYDRFRTLQQAQIDVDSKGIIAKGNANVAEIEAESRAKVTEIDAKAKAKARILEGQAEGAYRAAQGFNKADEYIGEATVKYAESGVPQSGIGGMMAQTALGWSVGQAVGSNVQSVMNTGFSQPPQAFAKQTSFQNQMSEQDDFGFGDDIVPEEPKQNSKNFITKEPFEVLSDLKKMLDAGLIPKEKYDKKSMRLWLECKQGRRQVNAIPL